MSTARPLEDEKVVFGSSFEGLLRALEPHEPALIEGLLELKIPPRGPFAAAYPLDTYVELMALIARTRFSHLPDMEAFTEIGRTFIRGFESTLVGRAMMAALRVMGPRRTLDRLTRSFRNANNYSELRVTQHGPGEFDVWCNFVSQPGFYRGLLLQGLTVAGAKNLRVDFIRSEGTAAVYRMRWDP